MSRRQVSRVAAASFVALCLLRPDRLLAADALSTQMQAVFERDATAVVKIDAMDDGGPLSGTGFFVDPDGTIFTNYSVGGDSRDIVISYGAERYPATRVAADARSGLAILKVEAHNTPFLVMGRGSDLNVASVVMTIGYPLDLPVTPNIGCVGGFNMAAGNRYFAVSHIRANVPAQRGEAGAPLINMDGQVVGLLESSLEGGAGCFVLPIEAAEKVQSDIMHFGKVRAGWLGIRFRKGDDPGSPIEVQGFVDQSPAVKAGVKEGDLIQSVNGRKVSSFEDVLNAAFYLSAGEEVPLVLSRAGQTVEINVRATANPLDENGPVTTAAVTTGQAFASPLESGSGETPPMPGEFDRLLNGN